MAALPTIHPPPKTPSDYLYDMGLGDPKRRVALATGLTTLVCYAARWPRECFNSKGQLRMWDPRPQLHVHGGDDEEEEDKRPTPVPFFAVPIAAGVLVYLFT